MTLVSIILLNTFSSNILLINLFLCLAKSNLTNQFVSHFAAPAISAGSGNNVGFQCDSDYSCSLTKFDTKEDSYSLCTYTGKALVNFFGICLLQKEILLQIYIVCKYKLRFVLSKIAIFNAISIICIGRNLNVHGVSSLSLQNPLMDLANLLLDC